MKALHTISTLAIINKLVINKLEHSFAHKKFNHSVSSLDMIPNRGPDFAKVLFSNSKTIDLVNIYLFKVRNKNTRKWCEMCSKVTKNTSGQRH